MFKVVPYIETLGSEEYMKFINKPFKIDNLSLYFKGWKSKEMVNWKKYTNDIITLEFFPTYYNIKLDDTTIKLPLPKTLNDFINDMNRLGVNLYWSQWVEEHLEPKHFLAKTEIKNYYEKLLHDINKDHELLNTMEIGNGESSETME
jgi:hypothetical protein